MVTKSSKRKKVAPVTPIFYPPEDDYEQVLQLEILGQPPRKSNSRQIVTNAATNKPMIIKSKKALGYSEQFLQQVPGWARLGVGSPEDPLLLVAVVYYTSNLPDLSVELVKDLLEKAEVLSNDRYVKAELLFFRVDKSNPRTEITLYRVRS